MKKANRSNFRVIVTPRRLGDYGYFVTSDNFGGRDAAQIEKEYEERCNEIVEAIKRHIDNVSHVCVQFETDYECSYCGDTWNPDADGINGCCAAANIEWAKDHPDMACTECGCLNADGHDKSCSRYTERLTNDYPRGREAGA